MFPLQLRASEKQLDFLERAKRLVEIPLLKQQFEDSKKEDREWFEKQKELKIEQSRKDHALALQRKHKLERMRDAAKQYIQKVDITRKEQYTKARAEFDAEVAAQKERLARREAERKEREERERKEREEREAREAEERERRRQVGDAAPAPGEVVYP